MSIANWAVLATFVAYASVELMRSDLFKKPGQCRNDGIVEIVSLVLVVFLTQPAIFGAVFLLGNNLFPQYHNALIGLNPFLAFGLFLVLDDMLQYWWHRTSHNVSWLYNLHRAHHNGRYMSVRLVFRNNALYYAMMPGYWTSAALVYLGLGWVYVGYIIIKELVIIAAHSDVAWDAPLYRIPALSPVMWVVERVISTPATHHAHHGRHADDPATYYKGNYGNLLFFWDVLFGTARITRTYPRSYGVENLPDATLGQQILWPVFPENKDPDRVVAGATPRYPDKD